MVNSFALGTAHAAFMLLAAFGALWLMQVTTPEAGFCNGLAWLKLGHRLAFAAVSFTLFANALETLANETSPRPWDFITEFALVMVIVFSGVRHVLVVRARDRKKARDQIMPPTAA